MAAPVTRVLRYETRLSSADLVLSVEDRGTYQLLLNQRHGADEGRTVLTLTAEDLETLDALLSKERDDRYH